MRSKIVVACALVVALAAPALACKNPHLFRRGPVTGAARQTSWQQLLLAGIEWPPRPDPKPVKPSGERDLKPYEGLAAWVDIFDDGPWDHPARMVRRLDKRGVRAIFVQTSTYGMHDGILHRKALTKMLRVAHNRKMDVVAWYVPSFAYMDVDFRRSMQAIRFRSRDGESFDSFALDIEATVVGNIARRNKRLLRLTDRIRARAGDGYALGAITPDPQASLYWPNFPWKRIANRYDVIVPMGYFSFFTDGYREVRSYTERNIRQIRRETGKQDVPIHVIGGIADDMEPRETRAFVHATKALDAFGASLYDSPITSPESWRILQGFEKKGPVPDGTLDLPEDEPKKKDADKGGRKRDGKKRDDKDGDKKRTRDRKEERAERRQRGNDQRGTTTDR